MRARSRQLISSMCLDVCGTKWTQCYCHSGGGGSTPSGLVLATGLGLSQLMQLLTPAHRDSLLLLRLMWRLMQLLTPAHKESPLLLMLMLHWGSTAARNCTGVEGVVHSSSSEKLEKWQ